MKKLLALALVAVIATGAMAQDNMMGMFFSPDTFNDSTTNLAGVGMAYQGYIVLVNPTVTLVAAYEVAVAFEGAAPYVLGAYGVGGTTVEPAGDYGWTNFGSAMNQMVGFITPVPVVGDAVVLGIMDILPTSMVATNIVFGPVAIPSIPGVPAIADGTNPDILVGCDTYSFPAVATINGAGVVAVEPHSLSGVKALFN